MVGRKIIKSLALRSSKLVKSSMKNSSSSNGSSRGSERRRMMDDSSSSYYSSGFGQDASSRKWRAPQHHQQQQDKEEPTLLDRLGGMALLTSIVNEFIRRVFADTTLQRFFEGSDPRVLRVHQKQFFAMALTGPARIQQPSMLAMIQRKHQHLFERGLDETHFDKVAQHLVGTLKDRGFNEAIINEVVSSVACLRTVFEQGAAEARLAQTTPPPSHRGSNSVSLFVQ